MFLFCPHSYTGFVISFYINGLCLTNINLPHSVRDACQSGSLVTWFNIQRIFLLHCFWHSWYFQISQSGPITVFLFTLASEIVTGTTPVYQRLSLVPKKIFLHFKCISRNLRFVQPKKPQSKTKKQWEFSQPRSSPAMLLYGLKNMYSSTSNCWKEACCCSWSSNSLPVMILHIKFRTVWKKLSFLLTVKFKMVWRGLPGSQKQVKQVFWKPRETTLNLTSAKVESSKDFWFL